MGYIRPTDAGISDSWQGHKDRTPPSREPGTDYGCAYGSTIRAAANGTVADVDKSAGGAEGRRLSIDLDDGRRVSYIHLSQIWVSVGQRVSASEGVAASGASANGSDWGVGAHVHTSLFPGHTYGGFGTQSTLDFEVYAGGNASNYSQEVANQQSELNRIRNAGLVVDGILGPKTIEAIKSLQRDLGVADDGDWGPVTQAAWEPYYWAHTPAPAAPGQSHTATVADLASLPNTRGLQKIAKLYGYTGGLDNEFGGGSQGGIQAFLNQNYGGSLATWLRQRWGYTDGDDLWGPNMAAAATRADTENWAAL